MEHLEGARCTDRPVTVVHDETPWVRVGAAAILDKVQEKHRLEQSAAFFKLASSGRGHRFRVTLQDVAGKMGGTGLLTPTTVSEAMVAYELPVELEGELSGTSATLSIKGVFVFIGYMLADRWENVRSYARAFTAPESTYPTNTVLGALVDFDHWLECPPRSAHEDQMRLHARISTLSGGYMRPIMSYNPWSDALSKGELLRLLDHAVHEFGFVGAKIYPPNGFHPLGPPPAGLSPASPPDPAAVAKALAAFWDKCVEWDIPVMSHAGCSMGGDDTHDDMGSPMEWGKLVEAMGQKGKSVRLNLGHFGGPASGTENWTKGFSDLMRYPHADRVFADLGYWNELECDVAGQQNCPALDRLRAVLNQPLPTGEKVADRVMFGTDWLLLSKEPHWNRYAAGLRAALSRIASPEQLAKIFGATPLVTRGGGEAWRCGWATAPG